MLSYFKSITIIIIIYSIGIFAYLVISLSGINSSSVASRPSVIPSLSVEKISFLSKLLAKREKLDYNEATIDLSKYSFGQTEPFSSSAQEK